MFVYIYIYIYTQTYIYIYYDFIVKHQLMGCFYILKYFLIVMCLYIYIYIYKFTIFTNKV